jgi:lactate permease
MWAQAYDPFGNMAASTIVAALPVVILLGAIGLLKCARMLLPFSGS